MNKKFDLMLNFGSTTFDTVAGIDKLNAFKFILDCLGIGYTTHKTDSLLQFIFKGLNLFQYENLKKNYYDNMHDNKMIYDINDVMFMSYDNLVNKLKCEA